MKFRYQLKQGLFNDSLSGQVKYPNITMTLAGGRDIAITLPVASVLGISCENLTDLAKIDNVPRILDIREHLTFTKSIFLHL